MPATPPGRPLFRPGVVAAMLLAVIGASTAQGQPVPLPAAPNGVETFTRNGTQFSRIRTPAMDPLPAAGSYARPINGGNLDFGLARTELTQSDWIDFVNTFNATPIPTDRPWSAGLNSMFLGAGWLGGPGLYPGDDGPQGRPLRFVLPGAANIPIRGMGFFGSALYCNWLHNDKAPTLDAILTGAYDLRGWNSSFVETWPGTIRQSGARFWIPNYDEWATASFFDPNRFGEGLAGWWSHVDRRERDPIPGPPGVGETNAGWSVPNNMFAAWDVPVGSYPNSQSPWGLLDTGGGVSEWLDTQWPFGFDWEYAGLEVLPPVGSQLSRLGWTGATGPGAGANGIGLRLASPIPTPGLLVALVVVIVPTLLRRQRCLFV